MSEQRIFWDYEEHLGTILTRMDDPLEHLDATVDFERFRPILEKAAGRPRGAKGGRPALDATEHMVRDRPAWLHFCGLKPHDTVPDANTLWDFREALIKADAMEDLFGELNRIIAEAGFISRSGQVVDSSLVAAPARHRGGEGGDQGGLSGWRDLAGRVGQGVAEGHGRALDGQAQEGEGQAGRPEAGRHRHSGLRLQDPHRHRQGARDHPPSVVTDAAANDCKRLREGLTDPGNTCRDVWGDTGQRSAENERWLKENGLNSRIRRKKPRGRPTGARTAKANGRKSKDRAKVEHIFAHRKVRGWG